jgi:hypothetical protein
VEIKINEQTKIKCTANQVSSDLSSDEVVILHLKAGAYFGLEGVGWRVWRLIQNPISVGELIETLCGEYEVEAGRCRAEVFALLVDLSGHGLIEILDE